MKDIQYDNYFLCNEYFEEAFFGRMWYPPFEEVEWQIADMSYEIIRNI